MRRISSKRKLCLLDTLTRSAIDFKWGLAVHGDGKMIFRLEDRPEIFVVENLLVTQRKSEIEALQPILAGMARIDCSDDVTRRRKVRDEDVSVIYKLIELC